MFHLDYAKRITVSRDLVTLVMIVCAIIALYFFSFYIQKFFSMLLLKFGQKIGTYSVSKEYYLQRYVYQHRSSLVSKLYMWVNEQLIALGLKRQGVTPFGYLLFWAVVSVIIGTVLGIVTRVGFLFTGMFWFLCFFCLLVITRVLVSERMEKREADIMNAVDLIVPELRNGVKNAIITYKDNFSPSLREDFAAFVSNIQDRGYTFNDAMFLLADNLGNVFTDFAQKAIYYEAVGETEMLDIFTDITETNRLRRELRDENTTTFANLKSQFAISTMLVVGYFLFLMFTDDFSRNFFLHQTIGKFLLVVMIMIVFLVMAYISTIKSRAI